MAEGDAITPIDTTTGTGADGVNAVGVTGELEDVELADPADEAAFKDAVLTQSLLAGTFILSDLTNSQARDASDLLENAEVGPGG
ncbi:MAG: hypothetical protein AAGE61_13430 [Pseudomonadota bacterium]